MLVVEREQGERSWQRWRSRPAAKWLGWKSRWRRVWVSYVLGITRLMPRTRARRWVGVGLRVSVRGVQ